MAVVVAVSERLMAFVGAVLLLSPALGCFLPYYFEKSLALEAMGRTAEIEELEAGKVVRLDGEFGNDKGFPLSRPFQRSSWAYGLGGTRLNLANLTAPVTIIVGEEDQRVKVQQIDDLYKAIPAGNKKMIRVSLLQHSYENKTVFGNVVRPELVSLAIGTLPNLACSKDEADKELLRGLDSKSWVIVYQTSPEY